MDTSSPTPTTDDRHGTIPAPNPALSDAVAALDAADASVRLRAALALGSTGDPTLLDALVRRCGIEPDFFVRDMLTWALTAYPGQAP